MLAHGWKQDVGGQSSHGRQENCYVDRRCDESTAPRPFPGDPVLGLSLGLSSWIALRAGEEDRKPSPSVERGKVDEPEPRHKGVRRFDIGQGPRSYWLYEPDQPRPEKAPVVVFLHGWFAVNPGFYGAWIDHLVRDGRIVIFPRYQNDVGTMPQDFLPNAMAALHDALGVLHVGVDHVRPDPRNSP